MSKKIFKKTYSLLLVLIMIGSLFSGVSPGTINAYADSLPNDYVDASIFDSGNLEPGSGGDYVKNSQYFNISSDSDTYYMLSYGSEGIHNINGYIRIDANQTTLKSFDVYGMTINFHNPAQDDFNLTVTGYKFGGGTVTYNDNFSNCGTNLFGFHIDGFQNIKYFTISYSSNNSQPVTDLSLYGFDVSNAQAPPSITTSNGNDSYTPGSPASAIDSNIALTSSGTISEADVSISNNFDSQDTLSFINDGNGDEGNIAATYNSGQLTLKSDGNTATTAQWQTALRAVTYSSTSNSASPRTINFKVTDTAGATCNNNKTININPLSMSTTPLSPYGAEDGTPLTLFSNTSISNLPAGQNISSINLTLSGIKDGTYELIAARPNVPNISRTINGSNINIDITGNYTAAAAADIINDLYYMDYADTPTMGTRTLTLNSIKSSGGVTANLNSTSTINFPYRQGQIISFIMPGDQNFGTSPTLMAFASSDLPVTFSSENPDVAAVSPDGTLRFFKTGSVTIDANQAGNNEYFAAPTVSQTFTVNAVAPSTPTSVSAVAGNGQATVSFSPPYFDGGSAITNYTVTATPPSGSPVIAHGTSSPITVTGLNSGTRYNFTVAAVNSAGTGTASAPVSATTSAPTPVYPISTTAQITGNSVDSGTGKTLRPIAATVTYNYDGTKAVNFKSQDAICLEQADGTISVVNDISKLGFASPEVTGTGLPRASISIASDGTINVSGLVNGSQTKFPITYDLGNGNKITIGYINVSVSENGTVSLTSSLIDPYGTITDAATGDAITGANVTLYYADTARNIANGRTPNTVVNLPAIDGFKPNNNANPQISDALGQYGFMVYPTADYYIVATKDGYDKYTSPTIPVEQSIVQWNFQMNKPIGIQYQSHVQNEGWQNPAADGAEAGTTGQFLRLEALKVNLINAPKDAHIVYQSHIQNEGWQNPVEDGAETGTTGQSLRLEAIKLSLENMPGYSIKYRVHVQNIGWMDWVSDGQIAGTTGKSLRIEAIEIKIVKN